MYEIQQIRTLSAQGRSNFASALQMSDRRERMKAVEAILNDPAQAADTALQFEFSPWPRRRELAMELYRLLGPKAPFKSLSNSVDFWSGFGAAYMLWLDSRSEQYLIGESARWILNMTSTRRHRHLLYGPFATFAANFPNIDGAMAGLASEPLKPGEVVERVCGKASLMRGTPMELATLLFYDPDTGRLKKGAAKVSGAGTVRRLSYYLSAIDLTVDYPEMSAAELFERLPAEFKA